MSDDDLLRVRDVCALLGVHPNTLYMWRRQQYGPVFSMVGKQVRYRRSAVEAFLAATEGKSTLVQPPAPVVSPARPTPDDDLP